MVSPNYSCSEAELYKICRIIWLLCQEHLSAFAAYKNKYVLAWVISNLDLIKTVEALDGHEARRAPVRDMRSDLDTEKADASVFFKYLKGYVKEAYKSDNTLYEAQLTEAGEPYYNKIKKGDWKEVKGLYTSMVAFVNKYQTVLGKEGYMAQDFATRLLNKQGTFEAAFQTWTDGRAGTSEGRDTKVTGNNDLKNRAVEVLADGQVIFSDNKTLAQKFVWSTIQAEVRGPKPAGVGGKVTDSVTEAPLSIGTATITALDMTVNIDKEGRYTFSPLPVGTYPIIFKAEGYQTLIVEARDVKADVIGRLNVALVPIAQGTK